MMLHVAILLLISKTDISNLSCLVTRCYHAHGTVLPEFVTDCSSLLTFKKYLETYLFSPSFRARFDCVNRPCSSLGRLRRSNFVKLHYIIFTFIDVTGMGDFVCRLLLMRRHFERKKERRMRVSVWPCYRQSTR